METLGFSPEEWQEMDRACRWIYIGHFHPDALQKFLSRCLAPSYPELAAQIEQFEAGTMELLYHALREQQGNRMSAARAVPVTVPI